MEENSNITNKFYDFINMYNAIIKHCMNRKRTYKIKLYHINNQLYFQIIDKNSNELLHNESIVCSQKESELIINMITSEFILNHKIRYAYYEPMQSKHIQLFKKLNNLANHIECKNYNYTINGNPMLIHTLENSIFTLRIYNFAGTNERDEILHNLALEKANKEFIKKI